MMARYQDPKRAELGPAGQASWDRIAGSRGGVRGPYAPLMRVPELAERVMHLGSYLRFEGLLAGAERELAILTAGRELGCRYEWVAHEPIARREGARPEAIEAIRTGQLGALDERERLIVDVVHALYRQHAVPDDLHARACAALGAPELTELVTLAGYYGMIAFVLIAHEVEPDADTPRPF